MTPLVALALGLAATATAADPPRELIHFGPAGATHIRVRAVVHGVDVDAAWTAAVGKLFALYDRDGNGTLDKAERAALAAPVRTRRAVVVPQDPSVVAPLRLDFPGDAPIDVARFAAAVRAAGLGPATLAVVPPRADAAAVSAALFKHLDADGDGRLSPAELAAARDRLAPFDANDDECLTPAELLDRPQSPGMAPAVRTAADATDLLLIDPAGGPVASQVRTFRGTDRATGEKRPDAAELVHSPVAVVDLDLTAGRATGDLVVSRPGLRVRFDPPAAHADTWVAAVKQLGAQTTGLLKDGPLDRAKAGTPAVLALFDLADRNADGKLDAAEAAAALAVLADLGDIRLGLTVADHGTGLFELLDRDGDGRLSPRELLGAAAVRPFADASGSVGPADLPRRLVVTATLQPLPVVLPAPPVVVPPPMRADAPAWFVGLDRNGDGDVSRREFVGSATAFRRLDTDGDGLISVAEATAAGGR